MKLRILQVLLILVFTSCGIGPRNLDGFSVYKYPISNNNKKLIKYLGVYIKKTIKSNSSTRLDAIVFSKKGECFTTYVGKNFWKNKDFWKHYSDYEYYTEQCQYRISNDTIIIQYFVSRNDAFYSKFIDERRYKILNKNTLKYCERISYRGYLFDKKKVVTYVNDTLIYFKEPTINFKVKQAWYKTKKWYKKGLHPSRQ